MPFSVTLRMYASLNDFLPAARRQTAFQHTLPLSSSVKDLIEAVGVPHTEVDLILANDEWVGFDQPVAPGDRIAVFPAFKTLDLANLHRLQPSALAEPCFLADNHLGRLTRYLRMLGFDAVHDLRLQDDELARRSAREDRILLTRDRALLKRKVVKRGYWLRGVDPRRQLAEVVDHFDLRPLVRPFRRCLVCNTELVDLPAGEAAERVPPGARANFHHFWCCPLCLRVYWRGSHYDRMVRLIGEILGPSASDDKRSTRGL